MDRTAVIERLRAHFASHGEGVVCAYLFGSTARGTSGERSDVDVGVLLEVEPPATLPASGVRLAGELERVLGGPVDVVVLNRAPPDLVHRVLRDGVLVCDRGPRERARFEVRARNAFFDLKPILDHYRRAPSVPHG